MHQNLESSESINKEDKFNMKILWNLSSTKRKKIPRENVKEK